MKVLTLVPGNHVGGAERVAATVVEGLLKAGDEVIVVAGADRALTSLSPQARGLVMPIDPSRKILAPVGAQGLARLCAAEGFDVVYAHHRWPTLLCQPARRRFRVPVVFHCHSLLRPRLGTVWGDRTIAVSEAVAKHAIALGAPSERVRVVYNGVKPRRVTTIERAEARRRISGTLRVPLNGPFIVSVGRLEHDKGLDLILRALLRVPDAMLVVLGDGRARWSLMQTAAGLGLRNRVAFLGWVDDPAPFFSAAAVSLMVSSAEGLPLTLLESLAHGCPIIATSVGGIPELFEDQVSGLLIDDGDEGALASAMARLLYDSDVRDRLAKEGSKTVATRCTVPGMVRAVRSTLIDAVGDATSCP